MANEHRAPWALLGASAVLMTLLAFGWTWDGGFVGDDFGYVGRYAVFPWSEWPGLFRRGWADGLFVPPVSELRPLIALTYMVDAKLWDAAPTGFRLTNLLLHASTATLVGLLAWRVTQRDRACALTAAVLFVLHPVHAEPVAWITGRNDVLPTLFMLAAVIAFIRYRSRPSWSGLATIVLLQAAAVFARESGLILSTMFLAADLVWLRPRGRQRWMPYVGCAGVLLVYFACRSVAFPSGGLASIGAGLPDVTKVETFLRFARHQIGHLSSLLPPWDAIAEMWRRSDLSSHPDSLRQVVLGLVILILFTLLVRQGWRRGSAQERRAAILFGPVWFAITTVPLVMTYFSARHLYPATVGLAIFLAIMLRSALRARGAFVGGCIMLAGLFCAFLIARLRPWHDAALISARATATLRALDRATPLGPLFLDVPVHVQHAHCWAWAVPHALRPPFTASPLDLRRPILAAPGALAYADTWLARDVLDSMARSTAAGWLVMSTRRGDIDRIEVPADTYHPAVAKLGANAHLDSGAAWREFIADLKR